MINDTIYRQAAIDAIHNYWAKRLDTLPTRTTEDGEVYIDTTSMNKILEYNKALSNFIKAIPSAQPELKTGKWIKARGMMPPEFHHHHCCSRCGHLANMRPPFGNREDLSDFCPNCGARMEGMNEID